MYIPKFKAVKVPDSGNIAYFAARFTASDMQFGYSKLQVE